MLLDAPAPTLAALLVALVADALLGEPAWLYRRVPHPVVLIGSRDLRLELRLLAPAGSRRRRQAPRRHCCCSAIVVGRGRRRRRRPRRGRAPAAGRLAARGPADEHAAGPAQPGRACPGGGARACARGLAEGRRAVALIVGRDPDRLDAAGVGRAAVESLAENLSDGVVAPLFWGVVAGLPGMLAYKAVNTLDSMVGHRSERYRDFGWASARLDDLVNLVPARLTGAALCLVGGTPAALGRRHAARRAAAPLAQRRLARGGHGRRPGPAAGRPARLCRPHRSTTAGWATAAPRSTPADIDRAIAPGLAGLVADVRAPWRWRQFSCGPSAPATSSRSRSRQRSRWAASSSSAASTRAS